MKKKKWSIDTLKAAIEERTKTLLADRLENLEEIVDEFIRENLAKIISAALGMQLDYGRWELRKYQDNPLTKMIQDLARKRAEVWVEEWASELLKDGKPPKGWKTEFKETYEDFLDRAVRSKLEEIAEARAEHQAQLVADMMTKDTLDDEKRRIRDAEREAARG